MLLQLSDTRALPGLLAHLDRQGFPATHVGDGVVDVLFPAEPAALAAAAELDVWTAENESVVVVPLCEVDA